LARYRRESPVCWMDEPPTKNFAGGTGYWAVFRHADIQQVSRHPEIFSSYAGGTTVRDLRPKDLEIVRHMMLNMDPPQHSKLRKIVNRVFTPQIINQLKDSIEDHAREAVDNIIEEGSVDFLERVAAEMPLLVLADIFGFPSEDRVLLHRWTDTMIAYDDPDAGLQEGLALIETVKQMFGYASRKTAEKRANPGNDVWSLIANATVDGEQLSQNQLDRFFQLLMIAGNETTRSLIANGMQLLTMYPEQRKLLLDDMSLLPSAIEEMLRYAPPVIQFRRTAVVDTELGGQKIAAGDKVVINYASANRDEAVFENPNVFDIRRSPNRHISFGDGTHFCLGANLARLEARVIFTELLTRIPDLRIVGKPVRLRSSFVTNFKHMQAEFTPGRRKGALVRDAATPALAPQDESVQLSQAASDKKHGTPILVLYGSNFGNAEDHAQRIGFDAKSQGFSATIAPLDDHVNDLSDNGAVIIVTATYNGTPPDNAVRFLEWLEGCEKGALSGVKYAVFGCGNHDWAATFQEIPRKVDELMERAGAQRVYQRGEGDEADDFAGQFEAWYEGLWPRLAQQFGLEVGHKITGPMFTVEVVSGQRQSPFVSSLGAIPMRVVQNRELLSGVDGSPDSPSTRHVELELPEGVTYRAGDHLGVISHNSDDLVQRVAGHFGFSPDTMILIRKHDDRRTFLPVDDRIAVHRLLADYVELQGIASRSDIRLLAAYAECPVTKAALEKLAATEGDTYRTEILQKRRSIIDLLEEYRACRLPIEIYLGMLPPLAPRYYSISSSPRENRGRLSITVGAVRGPARSGRGSYAGVCSNYIARLREGSNAYAFVRDTKSSFYLPDDPSVPVIMIGPGTGLAPFRGFLQDREARKRDGLAIGPSMTFFGCRHRDNDFIYADELQSFAEKGVTELHVAFSRMQSEKVYVQDLIWRERNRVWELLQQGALIYVCGDAGKMEPDVRRALTRVVSDGLGIRDAEAEAEAGFDQMMKGGRYRVDVWASS